MAWDRLVGGYFIEVFSVQMGKAAWFWRFAFASSDPDRRVTLMLAIFKSSRFLLILTVDQFSAFASDRWRIVFAFGVCELGSETNENLMNT